MSKAIYMDHNATTAVRPKARDAVVAAMEETGNASSVHGPGRSARRILEDARERVAALVGAAPDRVVFTSGGTEANNLALRGMRAKRIIVSSIEHPSVLVPASGAEILPVSSDGIVETKALEALLQGGEAETLVSVMYANNETGVVQPVSEVAEIVKSRNAWFHCDAVQAAGKLPVRMNDLGADMLSLSAHKIGGPQGVGALVLADGVEPRSLLLGGGQERRRRGGTENLPGIAGFGAAAEEALAEMGSSSKLGGWRDRLESTAGRIAPIQVFGANVERLANTTCFATPGLTSETLIMALDLSGVAVSAGSACSSGKVTVSHVLDAMGIVDGLARSVIRVSLGWNSAESDVDGFIDAYRTAVQRAGITAAVKPAAVA